MQRQAGHAFECLVRGDGAEVGGLEEGWRSHRARERREVLRLASATAIGREFGRLPLRRVSCLD